MDKYEIESANARCANHDIDAGAGSQQQLSWGKQLGLLLGVLTLSAAIFLLFYRVWGGLATPLQVGALVAAPLLATLGVEYAARREHSLYLASLIAMVAAVAFALNLWVLEEIFNLTPSQHVTLAWAAFALLLAYGYGFRLLLAVGLTGIVSWLWAMPATWAGYQSPSLTDRPEALIVGGVAVFAIGLREQSAYPRFAGAYRVIGLLMVFVATTLLTNDGGTSYLPFAKGTIENIYCLSGPLLALLAFLVGRQKRWRGVAELGVLFGAFYLSWYLTNLVFRVTA